VLIILLGLKELIYGIRCLKLGNTYREANNFDKAREYLDKGMGIVKKSYNTWLGKYWIATANEFYGYLFFDLGDNYSAYDYLNKAMELFSKIISQPDGSPFAIREVMIKLDLIAKDFPPSKCGRKNFCHAKNSSNPTIINLYSQSESKSDVEFNASKGEPSENESSSPKNSTKNNNKKLKKTTPTQKNGSITAEVPPIENPKVYEDLNDALINPENVYVLKLSGQNLTTFPAKIQDLTNLQKLDLSNNAISKIPENILGNLTYLIDLNLESNELTTLPEDIVNLKNLKFLNLSNNSFSPQSLINITRQLPKFTVVTAE